MYGYCLQLVTLESWGKVGLALNGAVFTQGPEMEKKNLSSACIGKFSEICFKHQILVLVTKIGKFLDEM